MPANKKNQLLDAIINTIDDYMDQAIEQEDFLKMKMMARHLEKLLSHAPLMTNLSQGFLRSKLGSVYYFISDHRSHQMLKEGLEILNKQNLDQLPFEDRMRIARSFLQIGAVYTELRLGIEAKELFEKAISIFEEGELKNYADLSWGLSHLGNVHRRLGNYETARDYLERSLSLNKEHAPSKSRMARTLAYLGSVYRGLGIYEKAIDSLKKSLFLYNKNFSNDHFRVGWTLVQLGNVYRDLGEYEVAKTYLEGGVTIFRHHLQENHINMGLTLGYLGNCYRELGEYKKSFDCLQQSLRIYQKYSSESPVRTGWVLFNLASTYKMMGNTHESEKLFDKVSEIYSRYCGENNILKARLLRDIAGIYCDKKRLGEAEAFIKKSLKILQPSNHIDLYKSLETLGEIYLKKSIHPSYANDSHERQNLKSQALDSFREALTIIDQHFSKNSAHRRRILSKIKDIVGDKT